MRLGKLPAANRKTDIFTICTVETKPPFIAVINNVEKSATFFGDMNGLGIFFKTGRKAIRSNRTGIAPQAKNHPITSVTPLQLCKKQVP